MVRIGRFVKFNLRGLICSRLGFRVSGYTSGICSTWNMKFKRLNGGSKGNCDE